ncbi:1-phosphofructokinase family hexose kinase [Chelativorans xinjiangense]|uniref:1-phosphofructokinase family hexose kinase n=1 Tax=Chelativorans xinjiangense TaxID=2681485 RepID=UPI00135C65A4|nr:1-phosphofructokinase family hexose kinase [Chelativorans xinjiangense]
MSSILTVTLNPTIDLFGEVEVVRPIRKMRMSEQQYDPGGGGINVARVIIEIGGDAETVFLGGGATGAWLDALLARDGIQRRMVPIVGETRVAFAVQERGSGFDYRFVPPGPAVSAEEAETCLDIVRARQAGYVVASGSLPADTPPDIYARMAQIVVEKGGRFVLDSSGEGLCVTLERSRVFLVKPSLGELGQLVGHELDEQGAREAAVGLVKRGAAEMVAVTMGAQGALLATADEVLRMPTPRVKVRSAIGAGDSFLGAMVWALSSGWAVKGAFHLGIAAGAAAVLTPGTKLCRREDIRALYPMSPDADTELAAGL